MTAGVLLIADLPDRSLVAMIDAFDKCVLFNIPVVENGWRLLRDELDGDDQAGREQSMRCQRGDVQVQLRGWKGEPIHVSAAHQQTTGPPQNQQVDQHGCRQLTPTGTTQAM